ncbi:Serine/threonine-protein kinase PrkC [Enhygromyxa salina]|uniref:Serine/threonine-protein kinase PrkC n=1 Tax=Enhygromyxa salina TaxID=215803 RepID=A0A2S9XIY5_9BACT|nr:protein kinase [Enhygromyxa salina]PRP92839.1 Serine/threonine-protein kinase PrkC [Enhygromyxa salina]
MSEAPEPNAPEADAPEVNAPEVNADELPPRSPAIDAAKQALGARPGFETRRQKQLMRAALFGKPATPTRLDRYLVLRELGAGGMGIVYLAYDDQLDRRVAVKLLRGSRSSAEAQSRLQREAQAMARLSHPNVVTVYEVGSVEDEVFVSMEYVAGRDMRAWLEAEPRSWSEVLAAYLPAGAGLAAAHEAGIVHRDFKPDNVLVGDDGRVRVADFGLAYAQAGELSQSAPSEPSAPRPERSPLDTPLTRTGALLGTPAYMAPEQFSGAPTDERTDQFSFCVALWEGLYGCRPFVGKTVAEIGISVTAGVIDDPELSASRAVPTWLRAVLERGLAREPGARWPSMAALLAALADDPRVRRRRRLRALGLGSGALLIITALAVWATKELRANVRQRYWNALTEDLLQIERERGLAQANDDARRARDATKLSVYRSYQPEFGEVDHVDPAMAAVLLREVSPSSRASETWLSAANLSLGRPLSHAVFDGHRDVVVGLVFAPDEDALYSASIDGEVWRWELDSGQGRLLYRHEGAVTSLARSPEGGRLFTGSADRSVRAWPSQDGAPELVVEHEAPVTALGLSPDGRTLASASKSGELRLTELESGVSRRLAGHARAVHALDFDAAGRRLVSASSDAEARIWALDSGEQLASASGHTRPIYHARFVADGRVVTAADDGTGRAWALEAGAAKAEALGVFTAHEAAISALAIHGTKLATAAVDGSVQVASLDDPSAKTSLVRHPAQVWGLRFDPQGQRLITSCFDAVARVLRVDGRGPVVELRGHKEALMPLELDPGGRWLATGSYDGELRIWDLARPRLDLPLQGHRANLHSVELGPAAERVLSAGADGSVRVWASDSGVELARLDRDGAWNVAVFEPRGERVAAGANNGDIVVWDPTSGERHDSPLHTDAIRALRFTADGALLSASSDHSARIWTPRLERSVALLGHTGIVTQIVESPANGHLATSSFDGSLRIWRAEDGAAIAVLDGHRGPIRDLTRSRAGVWATASDDHDARLWPDLDPSHAIVLRGHGMRVQSVAFDPAGRRVVTASADGTARVWDAGDGTLLHTLSGHAGTVWGARFVGDERVLTHADDNTLRLWALDQGGRAIVLSGHAGAVVDLAVDPARGLAVSASVDAELRIWRLAELSHDIDRLTTRLWLANISCLGVGQRIRDLGEDPAEAEASFRACERAHGRR